MTIALPRIFKNKNFMFLWSSQLLSQWTLNLILFLLLIRVFNATNSTIATSFVWVAYALPAVIIGPFAAASVDIFDKRKILMAANLLQALTLFSYAIFFERSIYLAYWVIFFYSLFNQFYIPSEASSLPTLTKKENYPRANGIFLLSQQSAAIVGFGLGGALSQLIGTRSTFYVTTVMLLLALISVSRLPNMHVVKEIEEGLERGLGRFFVRIAEGYHFIRTHKTITQPFFIIISLQVSIIILATNLPVIATDILKVSANSSGLLVVLPIGVGAAIGTLTVTKLLDNKVRKRYLIETALVVLGVLVLLMVFLVPSIPKDFLRLTLAFAIFILVGISFISVLVPSQTYLQEVTPGGMMGRVFGNFWILANMATIIPVVFSATITELFGVRTLLVSLAVLAFGGFFIAKFKVKQKKSHA